MPVVSRGSTYIKKIFLLLGLLTLYGCPILAEVSPGLLYDNKAKDIVKNLEDKQDIIDVINVYNNTKNACDYPRHDGYCYLLKTYAIEPYIIFDCFDKDSYANREKYNSDECILHRRSIHETSVNYFDYKRFLPKDSIIETDANFLYFVEYYNNQLQNCSKMHEATTIEKQECKDNLEKNLRTAIVKKENCESTNIEKYKDFLTNQCKWFKWAINHNLYEPIKIYKAFGNYEMLQICEQLPNNKACTSHVYTKSEAIETIEEKAQKFGEENICSTKNWKNEIKKFGCDL